ncbi:MAG TPA: hypothetical protein VGQ44_14880 [Gemmatimonadaceae bacterium]|jgi:predicted anti-sigma-YlaC factor YlaD|nr:hypothetical protein [Gemmatimonadaceae bacterium]
MTDIDLDRLLGSDRDDPGCDEAGELMDAYCDLVSRGEPVSDQFEEFLTHMRNCDACREDMEGLLALVRERASEEPR